MRADLFGRRDSLSLEASRVAGRAAPHGPAGFLSGDRGCERTATRDRAASTRCVRGTTSGRADALSDGRLPDARGVAADRPSCVRAGADMLELGVPYSDPLADGPVIHEAGTRALAAGANLAGVLEVARALAPSVPVVLMCYANMVFAPGTEAFVERLAQTGASGLIVPDLPLEEPPEVLAACDAHGLALVPLVAPTTPPERLARIGARRAAFSTRCRSSAPPASGPRCRIDSPRSGAERRRAPTCPSRSASGSPPPSTPARPPRPAPTA